MASLRKVTAAAGHLLHSVSKARWRPTAQDGQEYLTDGLVNDSAWYGQAAALMSRVFDQTVVDGAVNGAATTVRAAGWVLRATATSGRVRQYLFMMLVATGAAAIGLLIWLRVTAA